MSTLRQAAEALVDKVHEIINHPSYVAAMNCAFTHRQGYSGPSMGQELMDVEVALAAALSEPDPVQEAATVIHPFAEYANSVDDYQHYADDVRIGYLMDSPTVGDLRKARDFLAKHGRGE